MAPRVRRWTGAAATLALLATFAVPVTAADPVASDPAGDRRRPTLSSTELRRLAAAAADLAPALAPAAVVEVVHRLDPGAAAAVVAEAGGTVHGTVPGWLVEARIPLADLERVERHPGVVAVRTPLRADAIRGEVGEHVPKLDADRWHRAGLRGEGVKVGVIDLFDLGAWTSAEAAGDLPRPAGSFCRVHGRPCDIWSLAPSRHGVAVAEIIHDIAPGAELYLATTSGSASDVLAAVEWMAGSGVSVVNASWGAPYDGPGDGTGPAAAVVAAAAAAGITWVHAAGNEAGDDAAGVRGRYWRGETRDADGDGWLEFAPGDETLALMCGDTVGLRWSDWSETRSSDYDLFLFDRPPSDPGRYPASAPAVEAAAKAASLDDQTAGAEPREDYGDPVCRSGGDVDYLRIGVFERGADDDVIEFMLNRTDLLEHWSNPHSAAVAYCDAPESVCVGAVDPAAGALIAPYSNWGPTNDGRIKPDVAAPSGLWTHSSPGFNGTSAAAPVAAGVAALIVGAGLATTPVDVAGLLATLTRDLGPPGPDLRYGAGELLLSDPPRFEPFPTVDALLVRQYRDLLGRLPDAGGSAFWRSQLARGEVEAAGVVTGLLTGPEVGQTTATAVRLYLGLLGRSGDSTGLSHWSAALRRGEATPEVARRMAAGDESRRRFDAPDDASFVRSAYRLVLGRAPAPEARDFWQAQLASRREGRLDLVVALVLSAEFEARTRSRVQVETAYQGMLGRAPDPAAVAYWTALLANGAGAAALTDAILRSQEYGLRLGSG